MGEMAADQKEMISTEQGAVSDYEALIAAKKKEVSALTKSIETKMGRVGELGVEIATLKNDAEDTAESLEEDQKFAGDMKKNCAEKTGIHEEEKKVRSQEVVALADTIKIPNDDDALDLFKKTLPSSSSSFLQIQRSGSACGGTVTLGGCAEEVDVQPPSLGLCHAGPQRAQGWIREDRDVDRRSCGRVEEGAE